MPVVAKCTFFTAYKRAGVSFNLYSNPDSLDAMVLPTGAGKTSKIDRFWNAFLPMLGVGVEAPYVRVSDEAQNNDSVFYDTQYEVIGQSSTPSTSIRVKQIKSIIQDDPDFHNTAVLTSLSANPSQKGHLFMRFIPDDIINYPAGLQADGNWDKAFEKWIAVLKNDQWCIRALAPESTTPRVPIRIVHRDAANNAISVETFTDHGLAPNDTLRLYRVIKPPAVNKVWKVFAVIDARTVTLQQSTGAEVFTTGGGYLRKRVIQYPAIQNGTYRRVTGRKAGRPFGLPVGRRRKTAS